MARKAFHQELREIEESVIQMASLVESEIAQTMQALSHRDTVLAQDVSPRMARSTSYSAAFAATASR
jgi:phosphate uptake regulator